MTRQNTLNSISPALSPSRATLKLHKLARIAIAALALTAFGAAAPHAEMQREKVKVIFDHALSNADGKKMIAVTVTYPPGAKSMPHHHADSAFIYAYVLSGAIRSQVGGAPAKIYHAGESFYETPGAHHLISENASDKEPAALLAVFVVDSNDRALTTPDPMPRGPR